MLKRGQFPLSVALPPTTRIWCAHEYTLVYVREAARFDPANARLVERLRALERRAAAGDPITVPLTLEEERATNPFFRWCGASLCSPDWKGSCFGLHF